MNFEKIYTDCRGKYFSYILIIGDALKAPPYRNMDTLPESTPFYKNGALVCVSTHFQKGGACM
jgi:hypothetical protein